jgi:Repeat of unknown function (DUF5648)
MKSLGLFLAGLLISNTALAQTPTVKVVEYYSATMDHYFLTTHLDEQDLLDRGAIKGWQRTGYSFLGYLTAYVGLSGVCRFYYTNYVVDSHFYTASSEECDKLISEKIWQLEETGFFVRTPDAFGQCPATTQAIKRLYNNGNRGSPNHRYVSDAALIQQMLDRGWILEGPVFCAPVEGSSSSSTPPNPLPEPPPPPLPPAADPTNALGIYCPGATGTRIVRMDWPTSNSFTRVVTDSLAGEAMVFVLDVPYGVDPNNLFRLVGIYYSAAQPLRRASLSATPCDFSASLGPVSYVDRSTQLYFPFQVGNGSTYVIQLEPGKTYYISVQNLTCGPDENCRFALDLYQ